MKKQNYWKVLATFNLSFSLLIGLISLWIVSLNNDVSPTGSSLIGYAVILVALIGFVSSFYTRKEIPTAKVVGLIIGIVYIVFIVFEIVVSIVRSF